MSRQTLFYMLPVDRDIFIKFALGLSDTVVCARDANSMLIEPLDSSSFSPGITLCLWNRHILSRLRREWIPDPGYYRVDTLRMPVLEYVPSSSVIWEGRSALVQGRLFGDFDSRLGKSQDFAKWYEKLVRWIRKEYRLNPGSFGGYVAPSVDNFCKTGGYLLPNFAPPRSAEWIEAISGNQMHLAE